MARIRRSCSIYWIKLQEEYRLQEHMLKIGYQCCGWMIAWHKKSGKMTLVMFLAIWVVMDLWLLLGHGLCCCHTICMSCFLPRLVLELDVKYNLCGYERPHI